MKKYLWTHRELPAPTIVEKKDIGKKVKLSDFGFDSENELVVSPYDIVEFVEEPFIHKD